MLICKIFLFIIGYERKTELKKRDYLKGIFKRDYSIRI